MIHACLGTAEYPPLAMSLICRRVESGKNCLRYFLNAEKLLHSALSVPESLRRLSSRKKKTWLKKMGYERRHVAKQSACFVFGWNFNLRYFEEEIQNKQDIKKSPTNFHSFRSNPKSPRPSRALEKS